MKNTDMTVYIFYRWRMDFIRKLELSVLRENTDSVVECIDNDETAAVIADLVGAKTLLILTSAEGIYRDATDSSTLVKSVTGHNSCKHA